MDTINEKLRKTRPQDMIFGLNFNELIDDDKEEILNLITFKKAMEKQLREDKNLPKNFFQKSLTH